MIVLIFLKCWNFKFYIQILNTKVDNSNIHGWSTWHFCVTWHMCYLPSDIFHVRGKIWPKWRGYKLSTNKVSSTPSPVWKSRVFMSLVERMAYSRFPNKGGVLFLISSAWVQFLRSNDSLLVIWTKNKTYYLKFPLAFVQERGGGN